MEKVCFKYCIVPLCKNTNKTAPEKKYFHMPRDDNVRKKWCEAMGRDHGSNKSSLFCCEDHFNIEKDTENYMEYKIMTLEQGRKTKLRLRKDVIPYIFQCQLEGDLHPPLDRTHALKRIQQGLDQEALTEAENNNFNGLDNQDWYRIKAEPVAVDAEAEIEDEVPKVCRACLASGVRMVDVAAGGLQDTFEHVTGTELHTGDERPTQVCYVCCSQLQRFRAFCQMSRKADTYMTKLLKKGLQITEQEASKRHRLIKPHLDVTKNPLLAIHTREDPDECVTVEDPDECVTVEMENEVEVKYRSDSEIECETEIGSVVKTGTNMSARDPDRENEAEERLQDWETEGKIKIEIDAEEFDPFEGVEDTTVKEETCYCIQCAAAFPSQSELLKHIQNHTHQKLKQAYTTRQNVKTKRTKRDAKTKVESQCKLCNKTFAMKTQLVTHVAMEHGFGEFMQATLEKKT